MPFKKSHLKNDEKQSCIAGFRFCLIFCQFHPSVAYKSFAYKEKRVVIHNFDLIFHQRFHENFTENKRFSRKYSEKQ